MSKQASKDRASLCLFAYRYGRRCRMLRAADPPGNASPPQASALRWLEPWQPPHKASSNLGRPPSSPTSAKPACKPSSTPATNTFPAWGFEAWRQAIRSCFGPPVPSSPPPSADRPPLHPPLSQPEAGSKPAAQSATAPRPAHTPFTSTTTARNHLQQRRPCPKTQPRSRTKFSPPSNSEPSEAITHL